jgi:uncharacterized repeat protein (TIGR02543 family)
MRVSKSTQRCLALAAFVLVSLVFAAVGAWADFSTSVPTATALSADGMGSSPHDVQTYTPMLSWQFNDADAGDGQTQYYIRVGTAPGGNDKWDFTQTSSTTTRMYAGSALAPNTTYYWSVQVWDRTPQPSAVASATFAVLDIGLRAYDGTSVITFAVDDNESTSKLRISKSSTTYAISLVDPTAVDASKFRVQTSGGSKALKMMTAPAPAIGLGAGNLVFTALNGAASPASQTVAVSNAGGGTLGGLSRSISYGSGSGWLTASLDTTTAPATLTVSPSTGSLAGGSYTATITVASGSASNSPQLVNVALSVASTVTYSGNGSTGGSVPTDGNSYAPSATVTVLPNSGSLVKTGLTFAGWNTASDGSGTTYLHGQTFTIGSSNVTLYAKWQTSFTTVNDWRVRSDTSDTSVVLFTVTMTFTPAALVDGTNNRYEYSIWNRTGDLTAQLFRVSNYDVLSRTQSGPSSSWTFRDAPNIIWEGGTIAPGTTLGGFVILTPGLLQDQLSPPHDINDIGWIMTEDGSHNRVDVDGPLVHNP